jgi:hypothetical protein
MLPRRYHCIHRGDKQIIKCFCDDFAFNIRGSYWSSLPILFQNVEARDREIQIEGSKLIYRFSQNVKYSFFTLISISPFGAPMKEHQLVGE